MVLHIVVTMLLSLFSTHPYDIVYYQIYCKICILFIFIRPNTNI